MVTTKGSSFIIALFTVKKNTRNPNDPFIMVNSSSSNQTPRRWRATTLGAQGLLFPELVSEVSFEIEPDVPLAYGALFVHPKNVKGPETGGRWGHVWICSSVEEREATLKGWVEQHKYARIHRFGLKKRMISRALTNGRRRVYVLATTVPNITRKEQHAESNARRDSQLNVVVQSLKLMKGSSPSSMTQKKAARKQA